MRIAVIDDDSEFRRQIADYIASFYDNDEGRFQVNSFGNGLDFLTEFKCNYDIILLDIQMPRICGIDVAGEIRKKDADVIIMFITQTARFAIRGYEVEALDYILKPLDEANFKHKFARAVKLAENKQRGESVELLVNDDDGGIVKIRLEELLYVAKEKDAAMFHTTHGVYHKRMPLFKLEEILPKNTVAVANSGCIVNLAFVKNVKGTDIRLTNGEVVVLSRGKKKSFYEIFFDYVQSNVGGV